MVDAGGDSGSDVNPAARAEANAAADRMRAEGEFGGRAKPLDSNEIMENVQAKMLKDSGLDSPGSGPSVQQIRRTMDRTIGSGNVERNFTSFNTDDGVKSGLVHTSKRGTFLTTADGDKFRVEMPETADGKTKLIDTQTGKTTEVNSVSTEPHRINLSTSELGQARVHKQGERPNTDSPPATPKDGAPNQSPEDQGKPKPEVQKEVTKFDSEPQQKQQKGDVARAQAPEAKNVAETARSGDQTREAQAEKPGLPSIEDAQIRKMFDQLTANPRNMQVRKAVDQLMSDYPEQVQRIVKQMQQNGEAVPRHVERWSKALARHQARVAIGQGGEALHAGSGEVAPLKPGDQKALMNALSDLSSPDRAQDFLGKLADRLATQGNVDGLKVHELLKGLDPQLSRAAEAFLTAGRPGADMSIAQLDPTRMNSLRELMAEVKPVSTRAESSPNARGDAAAASEASRPFGTRPDGTPARYAGEAVAGLPVDAASGLPYDPNTGKLLDPATGRPVGNVGDKTGRTGPKDESREMIEKVKSDSKIDEEKKAREKELMLVKEQKLKEQKERELREKEEKRRKEDNKRIRYIVKKGDTLESIAEKQLRKVRLAPLIYRINKKIIPLKNVEGKQQVHLPRGLVIWLPSPAESREYLSKPTDESVPGKGTASSGEQFATAEEELAARFGTDWAGEEDDDDTASATEGEVERQLSEKARAKAQKRKKNIENVLGPLSSSKKRSRAGSGQYVVRLGDSLKSVAMKHPLVKDVSLWRLIAEVNKISTETDTKGNPKARLTRGATIKIPSRKQIDDYRERMGQKQDYLIDTVGPETEMVSKKCPSCERLALESATICPCGHEYATVGKKEKSEPAAKPSRSGKDAATIVLEAAGMLSEKPGKPVESNEVSVSPDSFFDNEDDQWAHKEQKDAGTRLVKSSASFEESGGTFKIALQVKKEEGWTSLVAYAISADKTFRNDVTSGKWKRVKMDLPANSAVELALNDLNGNWKSYKRKYLRS